MANLWVVLVSFGGIPERARIHESQKAAADDLASEAADHHGRVGGIGRLYAENDRGFQAWVIAASDMRPGRNPAAADRRRE